MRKLFITIFLGLFSLCSWSQERYALLRDLNENWFYYEEGWHPVTNRFDEYEAIFFRLNDNNIRNKLLVIEYPGEFSLFLEDEIIAVERDSSIILLDSIQQKYSLHSNSLFSVHTRDLKAGNLRTHLMERYMLGQEPEIDEVIKVEKRQEKEHFSFYALVFLIILFVLALVKSYYSKNLNDFYDLRKAISTRDVDESFLRGRLFSRINLLIMIFQCFIIGLFISLYLINMDASSMEKFKSAMDYTGLWINMALIVAGFVTLKFILIRNFTSLYNIGGFSTPHFMTFMRMTTIIFTGALLLTYAGIFAWGWHTTEPFQLVVNAILVLLAFSTIFIFLKLISASSYKLLYLFSYLCATEILPYVVVLKIAINHSI